MALGIGGPRLSSYTYGRTASAPKDVIERARQLLKESKKTTALKKQKFARKMSKIVHTWGEQLSTQDDGEIANFPGGVLPKTVHRWRKDECKSDYTALTRYDQVVNAIAQRLAADATAT